MILQSLVEYYGALALRGETVLPGWCYERVSFALNISLDGKLLDLIPLTEQQQAGKKTVDVPRTLEVPEREVRSSGVKPNFLCDNTAYIFGFDEKGKPERAYDCFRACRELHEKVLGETNSDAGRAVCTLFMSWSPEKARENPVVSPFLASLKTANLVFKINGGEYAQNDPQTRAAWQRHYISEENEARLRCLITGDMAPGAKLHGKIKGIPGAQSSGASLISLMLLRMNHLARTKPKPQMRLSANMRLMPM